MKNKFVIILLILLLAVLLIPYPTTAIPEWRIRVVDESGNPVANKEVIQEWTTIWEDYSESDSKISDVEGFVVFPPRKKIRPLSVRIITGIVDALNNFVMPHGSIGGAKARVLAKEGDILSLYYYEGGKMKDTLIVRR